MMTGKRPSYLPPALLRLLEELTQDGRKAIRQDPPADPMIVGKVCAQLAELDDLLFPGAWRVEVWGEIGYVDQHGRARWRIVVSGVGYSYTPTSWADFMNWRPELARRLPIVEQIVANFFASAQANATIEIAPWERYAPTYPKPGWVWVPTDGDSRR